MEAVSQTSCFIHVAFLWDTPLHRIPIICSNCREGRLCMISNCTFHYLRILLGFVQFFVLVETTTTTSYSGIFFHQLMFIQPTLFSFTIETLLQHADLCWQAFSMFALWSTGSWRRYRYSYNSFFRCATRLSKRKRPKRDTLGVGWLHRACLNARSWAVPFFWNLGC